MEKRIEWFKANCGYSYDPKTQTPEQGLDEAARVLAAAENHALDEGWYYRIVADDQPISSDIPEIDGQPAIGVVLRDAEGAVLGSLWGIEADADESCLRVVRAELALAAMAHTYTTV